MSPDIVIALFIFAFCAVSALWIIATDPLWSNPVAIVLWKVVKSILLVGVFLLCVLIIIGA